MIDISSPDVEINGTDSIYVKKLVKNFDLANWSRFLHVKSDEANGFCGGGPFDNSKYAINTTDPYLGTIQGGGHQAQRVLYI